MTRFHEQDDADGAGEEWEPQDPLSDSSFDPLLSSWPEATRPSQPVPGELEDPLFSAGPAQANAPTAADEVAWDAAPASIYSAERSSAYPDRFQPFYEERMTELRRRLLEETITIPRPQRRWVVTIRELAETLLLALLIFLSVRASFQNFRVEGASMQPSLENGEYLIVNKLSYARMDMSIFNWLPFYDAGSDSDRHIWGTPDRGDVIVFRAPISINRDFIKRIIGLPGDKIEIDEAAGTVKVNGQVLKEPYIQGATHCAASCTYEVPPANTQQSRTICGSNSCYFVMGDNRQNSSDSRQNWFVPEENIIGKALVTYWHDGGPELDLAPNHSVGGAAEAAPGD